jgi:hypothetical protein
VLALGSLLAVACTSKTIAVWQTLIRFSHPFDLEKRLCEAQYGAQSGTEQLRFRPDSVDFCVVFEHNPTNGCGYYAVAKENANGSLVSLKRLTKAKKRFAEPGAKTARSGPTFQAPT